VRVTSLETGFAFEARVQEAEPQASTSRDASFNKRFLFDRGLASLDDRFTGADISVAEVEGGTSDVLNYASLPSQDPGEHAIDSIFKLAMVIAGPRIGRTPMADHEIRPATWLRLSPVRLPADSAWGRRPLPNVGSMVALSSTWSLWNSQTNHKCQDRYKCCGMIFECVGRNLKTASDSPHQPIGITAGPRRPVRKHFMGGLVPPSWNEFSPTVAEPQQERRNFVAMMMFDHAS
jgi:hypothetical protein